MLANLIVITVVKVLSNSYLNAKLQWKHSIFCLFSWIWAQSKKLKHWNYFQFHFFFQKEPVFCSCSAEKDEKEEVIVHCKECKEDICQICYEAHLRLKMTKHHNFIWLNGNTEFVYKHQGSNKGIRIKVKSRNPQQA